MVVEVETAKASVEVPIPFAGTVSRCTATVGRGRRGRRAADLGRRRCRAGSDAEAREYSGNVLIGYGTSAGRSRRARRDRRHPGPPHFWRQIIGYRSGRHSRRDGRGRVAAGAPDGPRGRISTSPAIHGTGPGGLIMRRDVEGALQPGRSHEPDVQRIPLQGVRKAMADKLSRSRREIPEATVWVDVDATDLLAARAAINARRPEEPVSLLALIARFVVAGLARYPELNGRIEGDELVLPRAVGLGFAAQTERGLVVPVVPDAQTAVGAPAGRRAGPADRPGPRRQARRPPTPPAARSRSTTTASSASTGRRRSSTIPRSRSSASGRIIDRPWVVDGTLAVRKITELTLSFDHRACDGGTAGGFLRYVADCVESPISLLADL